MKWQIHDTVAMTMVGGSVQHTDTAERSKECSAFILSEEWCGTAGRWCLGWVIWKWSFLTFNTIYWVLMMTQPSTISISWSQTGFLLSEISQSARDRQW